MPHLPVPVWFTLIALGVFILMEGAAWVTHRYVMHGWGWGWHRSHHEPRTGLFEVNDLYGVLGAVLGTGLFVAAMLLSSWPLRAVATGVTLYGLAYAFVHDGLVHQRWPWRWVPKSGYARRLIQAHRLHHAVQTKDGAVSFGFVWAPDPQQLSDTLKARRAERVLAERIGRQDA